VHWAPSPPSPARRALRRRRSDRGAHIQRIIGYLKERASRADHGPQLRETLGICDRAYIINEGTVLASGLEDRRNDTSARLLGEHFGCSPYPLPNTT